MNNEFEDILNLCNSVEKILVSELCKVDKTGYAMKVEDNQIIFVKEGKKISLLNLLKVLELS